MSPSVPVWPGYAQRVPFRLGVVTNEISQDLQHALKVAAELGIRDVELNTLWGRQVTELTDAELAQVRALLDAHGMRVAVILDGAFKAIPLDAIPAPGELETEMYRRERQVLERAIAIAHMLGCERVRVFAFRRPMAGIEAGTPGWRPSPAPTPAELERLARGLRPLCELAGREGVTLVLENVRYCYADTGAHTRQVVEVAGSPHLKVIWDPANAYVSGEGRAYPDGYAAVRTYTVHVHLKDARFTDRATGQTRWECIGAGEVDWAGQIRALIRDGFAGVAGLETHWRLPGDTGERSTVETWRGLSKVVDRVLNSG
jgi:sugar phosphate isomerase/epimerase